MKKPLLLVLCLLSLLSAMAQSKFFFGPMAGMNISRAQADTWPTNYTRRNYLGPAVGLAMKYDISYGVSVNFNLNLVKKGYKVNSDTLGSDAAITRGFYTLNMPLGFTFKQVFNGSNFIMEKLGGALSVDFRADSTTVYNRKTNPVFSITEFPQTHIYPMLYAGIALGGNTENHNRYEFGLTYFHSFVTDSRMRVNYGTGMKKSFPISFGGGFLQVGFAYYFNWSNVKVKRSDYFTD
jgi:hypothetical protein